MIGAFAGISVLAAEGTDPTLNISDQSPDAVSISVTGGPGVHWLQKNDALQVREWSDVSDLTTRTNVTVSKNAPKAFFRAQVAPSNDILIFTNATSLLDQGRTTFRHDTLGSESFWGVRSNCTRRFRARITAVSVQVFRQKQL